MPAWYTSRSVTLDFGWKYVNTSDQEYGFFSNAHTGALGFQLITPHGALQTKLTELLNDPDLFGYEVKSIMPLTSSLAEHKSVWWKGNGGYGYGYGLSQITGAVILLQKKEDVTEEEYQRRVQSSVRKLHLEASLPELRKAHVLLTASVEADSKIDLKIIEKKPLLGSVHYHVANEKFKSQAEAEAHLKMILAEIETRKVSWAKDLDALAGMEEELKKLNQGL